MRCFAPQRAPAQGRDGIRTASEGPQPRHLDTAKPVDNHMFQAHLLHLNATPLMKRKPPEPVTASESPVAPTQQTAERALRESAHVLAPVVRWLLRSGVSYGALAAQLKTVFVDAARHELLSAGTPPTFSALSMLSGVHRKDVRALEDAASGEAPATRRAQGIPLASQVYTHWLTARRFRSRNGQPKPLQRTGPGLSFDTLAREISQDVHPRTVLDELLRLGLVRLDGETAVPIRQAFMPRRELDELTALFAANAADHIAAAVQNLASDEAPFLEHSVFADGLSAESVAHLQCTAVGLWKQSFDKVVGEARQRVDQDEQAAGVPPAPAHRIRYGVYFYSELTDAPAEAATPASAPARTKTRAPRPRRKP